MATPTTPSTPATGPVATDFQHMEPPRKPGLSKKLEKCGARFGIQFDMYRSVQAITDTGRACDPAVPPGTYSSW